MFKLQPDEAAKLYGHIFTRAKMLQRDGYAKWKAEGGPHRDLHGLLRPHRAAEHEAGHGEEVCPDVAEVMARVERDVFGEEV